jgi:hypothetical protein
MLKSGALDSIGQKHGTDKSAMAPACHDYLRKYEFFLKEFKDSAFTLLELGVFKGASLRTWAEYFPKARIVGVDIEPESTAHAENGIEVLTGDLSKNEFLQSLSALSPKVVIDDASHWWPDQLRAFFTLYPPLAPGSIFIIEDLHTSFEPLAPSFSCGFDVPPFRFVTKLAEYMTGDDRPAPPPGGGPLLPLERDGKYDSELRYFADRTDAVTFFQRAAILIRK